MARNTLRKKQTIKKIVSVQACHPEGVHFTTEGSLRHQEGRFFTAGKTSAVQNDNSPERLPKIYSISWVFFSLILLSLLVTGCQGLPFQSQTSNVDDRDSFASSRTSSDGFFVEWKGYREGYRAGSEAEFDLTIKNETDQPWSGRYCLQLMAQKSPTVITTLDQRAFSLRSGVGFTETITVQIPQTLDVGAYGLSLVVRRPGGPMVDMIPIQVGVTDEVRSPATEDDMDAALEACPPIEGSETEMDRLVAMAKEDLAQRLGLGADDVTVQDIEATEFPDASLGVPEVGQMYAQVITPGYIILLEADGQVYRYHGTEQRVVFVPDETEDSEPETSEPLPELIEGWVGRVYKLPPGNQFGQRFVRKDGEAFGINTTSESVRDQIEEVMWSGAQVKVWGTLTHGVPAEKAKHIQVQRLEVLSDVAPEPRYLSAFAQVSASSQAESEQPGQYAPYHVIDEDLETAWAEGASGPGIGEWVQLNFPGKFDLHALELAFGQDQSSETFSKNNRIKQATLAFSNGERVTIDLADEPGRQHISLQQVLGYPVETESIKIIIEDVYTGTEGEIASLAEVSVYGVTK
jgi:hypothetical protein